MADYSELKRKAQEIRDEVKAGANTANRIGLALEETVKALETENKRAEQEEVSLENAIQLLQDEIEDLPSIREELDTLVVNDLTTGGADKALSAEMGKVLKDMIPTKVSELYNDEGYITEIPDNLATKEDVNEAVSGKQDALTLTVKDNGNIVIGNISGQSKEFMPATPSGDPMHYAYITAGAEWNDTDSPIVKTAPWGDSVQHLPKHYYLNGLGDITVEQMREIYAQTYPSYITEKMDNLLRNKEYTDRLARTNLRCPNFYVGSTETATNISAACYSNKITEVFVIKHSSITTKTNIAHAFTKADNLKHVVGIIEITNAHTNYLNTNKSLETFNIKNLKQLLKISEAPNIRKSSILYAIQNADPTTAITITLHPDAYARLVDDADIVAALESKNTALEGTGGSISLVSA